MSQTPTYDQLRDERITVARHADSLLDNHFGKHRLPDDTTPAAAMRAPAPEPNIALSDDWSGFRTGHGTGHGKRRPRDDVPAVTAAASGRSSPGTADLAQDWSWFGPGEPDCATPPPSWPP